MSVCKYDATTDTLTKVAGNSIMPTWKGTLAEWTSTDKSTLADGTIISITDDANEDEGEIYSTSETRIGTWIDGKPLYRKTFAIYENGTRVSDITLSSGYVYSGGMPQNIDKIIDYHVPIMRGGDENGYVDNYIGMGSAMSKCFVPRTNGTFYFYSPDTVVWAYCIIDYTKTTD